MIKRFLVCIAAVLCITGCVSHDNAPKIGAILPLSGEYAQYGKEILAGIKCGMETLDRSAVKPELIVEDDAGSPAKADIAMKKLADKGAMIVLAGYTSQEVLGVKSAAAKLKLPVLTPAGSNDQITERNKYMFRVNFSDRAQARALAYYAYYTAGKRRMASLINLDENAVYSRDLGRQTAQFFANYGGSVVSQGGFRESDKDFTPVIKDILKGAPDVVFVPAYAAAAGRFTAQLRKAGYRGVILGGDGWYGDDFLKNCGETPAPAFFSACYVPGLDTPEQLEFLRVFKSRYKREPGVNEALGYDALRIAFYALREAEDSGDVLDRLKLVRNYSGAADNMRIMADGEMRRPVHILEVKKSPAGKIFFKNSLNISPDSIDRPAENIKRRW